MGLPRTVGSRYAGNETIRSGHMYVTAGNVRAADMPGISSGISGPLARSTGSGVRIWTVVLPPRWTDPGGHRPTLHTTASVGSAARRCALRRERYLSRSADLGRFTPRAMRTWMESRLRSPSDPTVYRRGNSVKLSPVPSAPRRSPRAWQIERPDQDPS